MAIRPFLSLGLSFLVLAGATFSSAQVTESTVKRPRILGISHAAFYVSDLAKARAFYKDFLGFGEPFSIQQKDGGELVWIKINDQQSIELFPASELSSPDADRLYHIALEVDDAEAMRLYLASKGIQVPDKTAVGKIGNKNYFIKDPNGITVEIVEYTKDGWTTREKGKFMPETRVSKRMSHVGVMVGELDASMKFYGDILGLKEIWRGSAGGQMLSWVNMRVPDGVDYLEFMLYAEKPSVDRLRSMHHICLEVPDVAKAGEQLLGRTYPSPKPPTPMKTGVNGKRQINYYDPDGTRVEVMEPSTFDGNPVPPSKAPPPSPVKAAGTP